MSKLMEFAELHRHEHFATWSDEELERYEFLKKKLEETHEKAEKYDELQVIKDDVITGHDIEHLIQENKELREIVEKIRHLQWEWSLSKFSDGYAAAELKEILEGDGKEE